MGNHPSTTKLQTINQREADLLWMDESSLQIPKPWNDMILPANTKKQLLSTMVSFCGANWTSSIYFKTKSHDQHPPTTTIVLFL